MKLSKLHSQFKISDYFFLEFQLLKFNVNNPENTNQIVLMKFGERAPNEDCVICGEKAPIMNMKNIVFLDIESNKKGVYGYHEKCLPKLTKDFAESLINVKNSNDLMDLKKYVIL